MHKVVLITLGLLLLILVVGTVGFFLVNIGLGKAFTSMGAVQPLSEDELRSLEETYGLDKPLLTRYLIFLANLFKLDVGISTLYSIPVKKIIVKPFVESFLIVGMGVLAAALLLLYTWMRGLHYRKWYGRLMETLAFTPPYVYAVLFLLAALWYLGLGSPSPSTSVFKVSSNIFIVLVVAYPRLHLVLSRIVMGESSTLRDYILSQRAMGLPEERIRRNASWAVMPSLVSQVAAYYAILLQLQVFIEPIIGLPGIGYMLINGVRAGDIPLTLGAFTLIGIASVIVNSAAYLVSGYIDPRQRLEWH